MTCNRSEIFKAAWKTFKTVQASQIRKIRPCFGVGTVEKTTLADEVKEIVNIYA